MFFLVQVSRLANNWWKKQNDSSVQDAAKMGKNGILSTPSDVSSAFQSDGSDGSADGVDKC